MTTELNAKFLSNVYLFFTILAAILLSLQYYFKIEGAAGYWVVPAPAALLLPYWSYHAYCKRPASSSAGTATQHPHSD